MGLKVLLRRYSIYATIISKNIQKSIPSTNLYICNYTKTLSKYYWLKFIMSVCNLIFKCTIQE